MAGPPRRGHPAACLALAGRIVPAAPAGGRNAARHYRPSGFLGPRRPACRPGAAPPGRGRTRATGSSGRAAQWGPRGQNRRTDPFGMRRGGQRGHGRQCGGQAPCAAHSTAVDRILGREPRTRGGACRHAKGRPTGGVKGGKAARGDAKRARRPKIWATATPGRESNLWPSSIYSI